MNQETHVWLIKSIVDKVHQDNWILLHSNTSVANKDEHEHDKIHDENEIFENFWFIFKNKHYIDYTFKFKF
jgi:alpha-D-ribose 1-methylphosphonate 5-triphosphate synthase subunit PhnH